MRTASRRSIHAHVPVVLAGLLAASAVQAQATATTPPSTSEQIEEDGAGLITPADIRTWNTIRQTALSNDGNWFAYVVGPREGDLTVVVRKTERGATETRTPVGDGGGSISMSGDSKWLGYLVAPPRPASGARGARGARGGARTGGRGGAGSSAAGGNQDRRNTFVLTNLATGEKREFERIRRFAFNAEQATWIALQGYPPESAGAGSAQAGAGRGGRGGRGRGGGAAPSGGGARGSGDGADLLLYDLASGDLFNMGVVGEWAFDDSGEWLAYTMDSPDQVGNGVQLRNMKTNVVRSIENDRLIYRHLAWVDSADAISVMRGRIDEAGHDTVFSVAAYALGPDGPVKRLAFDPVGRSDFPEGWKLASERAPRYADDLSVVFFGIREAAEAPAEGRQGAGRSGTAARPGAPGPGGRINQAPGTGDDEEEDPTLILWHAKDPRLQSQQMVQEAQDRAFNYLAEYRPGDDRFIRLADDDLRTVVVTPGERFAYGTDNRAYQQASSYSGRNYQDIYRIDLATGTRSLVWEKRPAIGGMTPSPDGRNLLFWGPDGNYWVLDLATGDTANLTRGLAVSFVDDEDDHNNLYPPPTRSLGWAEDGSSVLLYDNWDVWKVPATPGGPAVNLTGDGRERQVRYQRLYQFDSPGGGGGRGGGRGGFGGSEQGIDLSKPLFFGTYAEWTKEEGLARVDPGEQRAKTVFFEDARFNVTRAKDADVYLYTRQTFTEFPDYRVFDDGFESGYRITDANPQMKDFAWSAGTRLIDYTSDKGDRLQATLYLPANYEPGRQYPLLVTIYEKRSQNKNNFVSPSETRAPDPTLFTNRGYAVLDPDIVYRVNDPGMSAVWCVVPAVKAAIATGIADPDKVGLWGHSWGGYQTAFLVTQTDIFSAAIAGAPLTDMVSMYSSVYWNTGGTNQAIFESSQGRFRGNFIDNYDAYIRNSPAFHAESVTTPLIILHNDKDGAVDFNQGITYFNTLRQLGKDVIMLEYVGENHGLSRPANQKDYARRMSEWFDHHLKGEPAADWILNGIPRLEMEEHLRSRRDTVPRIVSE